MGGIGGQHNQSDVVNAISGLTCILHCFFYDDVGLRG
jgi:hypothetical protein